MTPCLDKSDRKLTLQLNFERELRSLMTAESVEIVAKIMAHLVHRDLRQRQQLTELFRNTFLAEDTYLLQCRTRSRTSEAIPPGQGGSP
jgi:hypothetical protein